jgi:hypothetical protein
MYSASKSHQQQQQQAFKRRSSSTLSVGDRKKPMVKPASIFSKFAEEDASNETHTLTEAQTLLSTFFSADMNWASLMEETAPTAMSTASMVQHSAGYWYVPQTRLSMDDLEQQRFAINLEEVAPNTFDVTGLCHGEWVGLMTWLYAAGWWVDPATETPFRGHCAPLLVFKPADLPPRIWVEPEECVRISVAPSQAKTAKTEKTAKSVVIPRFCRAVTSCEDTACRYVHGNTIPRLNEPCGFGAACGASDPTGVKRSQCLRIHPGETWTPQLVIHRPVPV